MPRLLADGLSTADIAKELFLSEGTVRNYVSNLFIKLGVNDRTQAAVVAVKHGLVKGADKHTQGGAQSPHVDV